MLYCYNIISIVKKEHNTLISILDVSYLVSAVLPNFHLRRRGCIQLSIVKTAPQVSGIVRRDRCRFMLVGIDRQYNETLMLYS